jgi:hypothetical protein
MLDKASVGMPGGWTSLAMLALLNAGVNRAIRAGELHRNGME